MQVTDLAMNNQCASRHRRRGYLLGTARAVVMTGEPEEFRSLARLHMIILHLELPELWLSPGKSFLFYSPQWAVSQCAASQWHEIRAKTPPTLLLSLAPTPAAAFNCFVAHHTKDSTPRVGKKCAIAAWYRSCVWRLMHTLYSNLVASRLIRERLSVSTNQFLPNQVDAFNSVTLITLRALNKSNKSS